MGQFLERVRSYPVGFDAAIDFRPRLRQFFLGRDCQKRPGYSIADNKLALFIGNDDSFGRVIDRGSKDLYFVDFRL
jgi:hypothetical protein